MPHDITLIATITMGLVLAFLGGLLAHKLRLPPLVGYLLAGVAVGPYTPGFVGDAHLAAQLAEIGVILLMFGVGLHFSISDLLEVRAIAIPGAIFQIAVATGSGLGLALLWGWTVGAGWSWGWPCRSPARWCCCVRWSSATHSTQSTAVLRLAGSSSRTS